MSIATSAAIAIGVGVAGAGASAAGAASQAGAANNAANLQAQAAANSLAFQKQEFATNQANIAPFLKTGQAATTQLGQLAGTPGQGLLAPWTGSFQAPTADQAAATPGYQFQLQQGEQALQNSAAAKGTLLSGGTGKALEQYGQGLASTNYQQVYNNALGQYQQSYNEFQNNQSNQFNRLSALAGSGQTAATNLGQQGQQAASNVAGINSAMGQQVGQNINNAGAATASGYVGVGNSLNNSLTNYQQSMLLNSLNGSGGGNLSGPAAFGGSTYATALANGG